MDTRELAEVVGGVISEHLNKNGKDTQKNIWVRFIIQHSIVVFVVSGIYFTLRGDVDQNVVHIKENSAALKEECDRSKRIDEKVTESVADIKLKVNTIKVKQDTIMAQQQGIVEDVKDVDDKVDEVLKRLPK